MTYDLYAERDCCKPRLMCRNASLDELADLVEEADAAGQWPVGFEAIARLPNGLGQALTFADIWEETLND